MPKPRKVGRPATLPGGEYVTVKFSAEQMRAIRKRGGFAGNAMPGIIRGLVDAGLKAKRAR